MEKQFCDCGKEADQSIITDMPICSECWKVQVNMLLQFKQNRTYFEPSISKILENLYLGNEDAAIDKKILDEKGITHIVIAGKFLEKRFPNDYDYLELPIHDSVNENIKQYFEESNKFIHTARENGKVVFVHCAAGVSRSATIVTAYLMIANQWGFEKSYEYVKSKRNVVCANSGFKKQLSEYEIELKDKVITK